MKTLLLCMTVACVLVAIQIEAAPGKDKGKGGKSGEENSTTTQRSKREVEAGSCEQRTTPRPAGKRKREVGHHSRENGPTPTPSLIEKREVEAKSSEEKTTVTPGRGKRGCNNSTVPFPPGALPPGALPPGGLPPGGIDPRGPPPPGK